VAFDPEATLDAVDEFCRRRDVWMATRLTLTAKFDDAARIAMTKGPDERWRRILGRGASADIPTALIRHSELVAERGVYNSLIRRGLGEARHRSRELPWFLRYGVVSVGQWSLFSEALSRAHRAGLGWVIPACRELLLVPAPAVRFAEGSLGVLHDDTGHPALQWHDGSGLYFLHGAEFDVSTYRRTIAGALAITDIAALPNADQRSIALRYLSFQRLVTVCGAQLLDTGTRGTKLYRLRLPDRIAADRPRDYGRWDYFIHMRDASRPEREFIEWVDPAVGRQGSAELCQAHAFGISLENWFAIEQEG
jgi:hypothetical protein